MTTASPGHRTAVVAPGVRQGLKWAVLPVLAVGVAAVVLGVALYDAPAAAGAAVGTGLVLFFFGFGAVTVNLVAARLPSASLLVALLTYTLEVLVLALVFWRLTSSGATGGDDAAIDADWLGLTTIVATLTWTAGQIIGALRGGSPES